MEIEFRDEFDLNKTAYSGQCFRWNEIQDDVFSIIAESRMIHIRKVSDTKLEADCDKSAYDDFWAEYFDADTDYGSIRSLIDKEEDPFLFEAAQQGKGIRILRQQPWETLISFIISQRKSIPAIKTAIENLCMKAGSLIGEDGGRNVFAFPEPEQVAALSDNELGECGLGYRVEYIKRCSRAVVNGEIDFDRMKKLNDTELEDKLEGIYGVGPKVASCTRLFGFHRLDAFPKDVWINRVLDDVYHNNYDYERYSPYNGVMQQYLFFYYRNRI